MKGVFAAVATPMRDDLSSTPDAFAAALPAAARRRLPRPRDLGTTGEANSLSVAERIEAIEALVADGIPADVLLPAPGACALPDAVALAQTALALGAPGVLALPPFYYKGVSDDGLFRFFAELIERVGDDRLRLFLYHIPPQTVLGFSPELIGRLLDAYPGTIAGTKDSAGDRGAHRAHLQGLPRVDRVRRTEKFLLDTLRWAGTAASRPRSTSRPPGPRRLRPLRGGEDASAEQAELTEVREFLDGFPAIPAMKAALRAQTGDDVWRNLRPPLDALDRARVRELLAGL